MDSNHRTRRFQDNPQSCGSSKLGGKSPAAEAVCNVAPLKGGRSNLESARTLPKLVAVNGIEPLSHRYERCILPLNYTASNLIENPFTPIMSRT